MATVSTILTNARYDLRDENQTQYTDAMLVNFLNRGLFQLCSVLGQIDSDWVKSSSDLDLTEGDNYVALPTDFSTPISAWIDTTEIYKDSWEKVKALYRNSSSSGQPYKYAIESTNIIFNCDADDDYTIEFLYKKTAATLTTSSNMPFNDEFDLPLMQSMILIAKHKDEYDVAGDAALQDFFMDACNSKIVSRNHTPKRFNLGF